MIQGEGYEIARVAERWPNRDAPLTDATSTSIELPNGDRLNVPTTSTSPVSGNFQTARLRFSPPARASVKPTWRMRTFFMGFVGFGIGALVLSISTLRDHGWVGLFPLSIALLLFSAGTAGLAGLFHCRTMIDAVAGTVTQSGPFQPFRETTTANIAAVQICSGREELGEASRYITYELNLVLREPSGARWTLMNHSAWDAHCIDGQRLADMLGVPFVDHTRHG